MDDPSKACRECGEVLALDEFPIRRDQADGHHWWCFPCKRSRDRSYSADYREANPEARKRSVLLYTSKESTRTARSRYAREQKYGLTAEAFAAKLEEQGGHCPFCPPGSVPNIWVVDHDHRCCPGRWSCGRCVRAILCHRHNRALGIWDDDPDMLRAAADYIERHGERIAQITAPPRVKASRSGEGHQNWKGDDIGAGGRHSRIWRAKGRPEGCVNRETAGCISEHFEWVPLKGTNKNDPENYVSMCKPCRLAYEGRTGGGHPNAKLTNEQAAEVRRRYTEGGISQKALAAEFGVSQPMISTVVRGTTYAT